MVKNRISAVSSPLCFRVVRSGCLYMCERHGRRALQFPALLLVVCCGGVVVLGPHGEMFERGCVQYSGLTGDSPICLRGSMIYSQGLHSFASRYRSHVFISRMEITLYDVFVFHALGFR